MKYLSYLFAGYTAVWIILFLYFISLKHKVKRLSEDIKKIKENSS